MRNLTSRTVRIIGGEDKNDNAIFTINLPVGINYRGGENLQTYKKELLQDLTLDVSVIFDLLEFIADAHIQTHLSDNYNHEYSKLLARVGDAYCEAIRDLDDSFENLKTFKEYSENIVKVSPKDEFLILGEAISTLFKSEKIPAINTALLEIPSILGIKQFTPENIAEVLRNDLADGVLDLSNHSTKEDECLDLAKHFVAIIDNPATPAAIKEQVERALVENASSMESYKDPGYIASILCRNQDENKD